MTQPLCLLGSFGSRPLPSPLSGRGDEASSASLETVLSAELRPVPGGLADGRGLNRSVAALTAA